MITQSRRSRWSGDGLRNPALKKLQIEFGVQMVTAFRTYNSYSLNDKNPSQNTEK